MKWLASVLVLFLLLSPITLFGASLVVNSTLNAADQDPGNGICDTALPNTCTLVAAIQEANANFGPDIITFASQLTFDLSTAPTPQITGDDLTINGSSQWNINRPGIILQTYNNTTDADRGLRISSSNIVIKGIEFQGAGTGIDVSDGDNVTIGGPNTTDRNIFQVGMDGVYGYNADDIIIASNWFGFIGINNLPDTFQGPDEYYGTRGIMFHNSGTNGAIVIRDNVIGEYSTGIYVSSSNQLHITGNKVGVWDNASNSSFPCGTGIYLISTQGELLQNAISQNSLSQLQITYGQNLLVESNTIGSTYFPAAGSGISTDQSVGFTLRFNTIQNNKGYGIDLARSTQFTLEANFILTNTTGGIRFSQTTDSSVVNNTIHSNGENDQVEPYNEDGILLENSSGNGFTGNRIGLYLGANEGHGIHLIDSSDNTIGGYVPTDGNIIGNNFKSGILIEGTGSRDNEIGGNFIGFDNSVASYYQIQPNGNHGIGLYDLTESNTIGGVSIFSAPNVIVSNSWSGIAVVRSNYNHISDNYIGTDTTGKALGNGYHGVNIVEGNNNTINSNTVAHNGTSTSRQGVAVDGVLSYGNSLSQNSIYQNGSAPIVLLNGANSSLSPPTLSRTDNTLSGTTCANCTVEFFSGSTGSDIRFYEAAVQANGAGAYSYQLSKHVRGKFMRATATDLTAGTSQTSDAVWGYSFPWNLFNVNFRKR